MIDFSDSVNSYLNKLDHSLHLISRQEINVFYDLILQAYEQQKQIFVMGNGGSAATASHMTCDFNKGMSYGQAQKFRMICLNDNIPTMMALTNDVGYDVVFLEQLKNLMNEGDVTIGISGSGNSENVVQAISYANQNHGITIAICGYNGGKLKKSAQHSVHIPVNDMQIVEDIHLIINHMTMRVIGQHIGSNGCC